MDEQAVLTVASYCKLFDHFTGLQIYRLRSHVRKSVPGIGQAELDAIDVGVALRDDEMPIVFPIEAKAAADALNRVQIFNMVQFSKHYFPGMTVRPLAIKVDHDFVLHIMEFVPASKAAELKIVKSASYVLSLSDNNCICPSNQNTGAMEISSRYRAFLRLRRSLDRFLGRRYPDCGRIRPRSTCDRGLRVQSRLPSEPGLCSGYLARNRQRSPRTRRREENRCPSWRTALPAL